MLNGKKDNFANPKAMNALALAFVGDGVYSLLVRERLATASNSQVGKLHRQSVELVNAHAQSEAVNKIIDLLTEDEISVFKRGRNANSTHHPKNSDVIEYRRATGFETLFGYLYLSGQRERIYELFRIIFPED